MAGPRVSNADLFPAMVDDVTAFFQLTSLDPIAIAAWNDAPHDERTIDVALWHPPQAPPLQQVRLRFCGRRLVDHSSVPRIDADRILQLAVIPPLVNPHTHLEFSTLTERIAPATPFTDWVRAVIRWRMDHPEAASRGIRCGLQECHDHSVAAAGEISSSVDAVEMLRHDSIDIVSFRELIGPLPDQVSDQIAVMNQHLNNRTAAPEPGSGRRGISPHAPYSVHPDLFTAAVHTCRSHAVPLAMHLAETTDELELLDSGTGRFAEFLQDIDQWDPQTWGRGGTVLSYLQQLATLPTALAIHCNYLNEQEIRFLGQHPQVTVVYCPRTHEYFGHQPHPWRRIQASGGTVVLGTDGRGSSPDLSIWKELQFVAAHSRKPSAANLVPMVTTTAATALGLDDLCLTDGGFHATVIELPANADDPGSALLSANSRPVARLVGEDDRVRLRWSAAVDERSES